MHDEFLCLKCDDWCTLEEFFDFYCNLWKDIGKYKYDDTNKDNIEQCHHMIGGRVLSGDTVRCIAFSGISPCMELICKQFPKFQKYICKQECDKKERKKIC